MFLLSCVEILHLSVNKKRVFEFYIYQLNLHSAKRKNSPKMSEFNCEFNAPMFVDFENLDQEPNPDVFFDTFVEKDYSAPILKDVESKENVSKKLPPLEPSRKELKFGGILSPTVLATTSNPEIVKKSEGKLLDKSEENKDFIAKRPSPNSCKLQLTPQQQLRSSLDLAKLNLRDHKLKRSSFNSDLRDRKRSPRVDPNNRPDPTRFLRVRVNNKVSYLQKL